MFIGRDFELKILNDLYEEDRFQFIPITGRRRVGKTRLIQEFIRDKPAIFFRAVPGNESLNLSMFNELVSGDPTPVRLDRILWKAEERSGGKRLVVVIDEYPNLVEDAKHNGGLINNFIESVKDQSRLFLILCGSSMSIMESEVLGKKSPLCGRRTGQIRLYPFDFATSAMMLDGFGRTDMITIYGLVGGIPYYLEQFNPKESLEENIRRYYLNPTSVIFAEPEIMFLKEFRKPATYYSVVHAIAMGKGTPSEISSSTDIEQSLVSHMLDKLCMLGFVGKDQPYGVKKTKDPRYYVKDRLLASYYKFIYPSFAEMTGPEIEGALDSMLAHLNEYLGHVFEDICHEYVRKHGYRSVGRWWKGTAEIDVVASNAQDLLFAECRYRNELTDADLIDQLFEKSGKVDKKGLNVRYALFSKSGFTRVAEMRAKTDGVRLYGLDDIFSP